MLTLMYPYLLDTRYTLINVAASVFKFLLKLENGFNNKYFIKSRNNMKTELENTTDSLIDIYNQLKLSLSNKDILIEIKINIIWAIKKSYIML